MLVLRPLHNRVRSGKQEKAVAQSMCGVILTLARLGTKKRITVESARVLVIAMLHVVLSVYGAVNGSYKCRRDRYWFVSRRFSYQGPKCYLIFASKDVFLIFRK